MKWAACMPASRRQLGPGATKSVTLKSKSGECNTGQRQQMERWVEPYLERYATQNVVSNTALNAIPDLSVLDELDTEPFEEELSKAIDCLSTGKAPGKDSIPLEIMNSWKDDLVQDLHELNLSVLGRGHGAKRHAQCQDSNFLQNKGNHSDCNSYRGISLLSTHKTSHSHMRLHSNADHFCRREGLLP